MLIDGYPRSIEQMQALHTKLAEQTEVELVKVIEVSVSEQVAKDRVLGRARGADDDVEVFNNRMRVFLEPLAEIRAFYGARDLLHTINGERTIEEIVEENECLCNISSERIEDEYRKNLYRRSP